MSCPAWMQQPGESDADFVARRHASLEAWYAERGLTMPPLTPDIAAGVVTYDGNGNPKGARWW